MNRVVYFVIVIQLLLSSRVQAQEFKLTAARPLLEHVELLNTVSEMYNKVGIEILIVPMPLKRSIYENSVGISDGELLRVESFNNDKEYLLKVPTSIGNIDIHLFTSKSTASISLDNYCEHRIAIIKDAKIVQKMMSSCKEVIEVNSARQLLQYIKHGRADAGVMDVTIGLTAIKELNETDVLSAGSIKKIPLYHFINIKHKELLPQLDLILNEIKG